MFSKLAAAVGIGAATIDAELHTEHFVQGGMVEGVIRIKGGNVAQEVDAIVLKLKTYAKRELDEGVQIFEHSLAEYALSDAFEIGEGEEKEVGFEFQLPDEAPITALPVPNNKCHVWLETSLDIDNAIDPSDRDGLVVHPHPVVEKVLNTMTDKGMNLVKADVEEGYLNAGHFQTHSGIYQEIEFKSGGFLGSNEVELSFVLDDDCIHCLAEVDRAFRGDSYQSFTLPLDASDEEVEEAVSNIVC